MAIKRHLTWENPYYLPISWTVFIWFDSKNILPFNTFSLILAHKETVRKIGEFKVWKGGVIG